MLGYICIKLIQEKRSRHSGPSLFLLVEKGISNLSWEGIVICLGPKVWGSDTRLYFSPGGKISLPPCLQSERQPHEMQWIEAYPVKKSQVAKNEMTWSETIFKNIYLKIPVVILPTCTRMVEKIYISFYCAFFWGYFWYFLFSRWDAAAWFMNCWIKPIRSLT